MSMLLRERTRPGLGISSTNTQDTILVIALLMKFKKWRRKLRQNIPLSIFASFQLRHNL
jgi:hypothetical protein